MLRLFLEHEMLVTIRVIFDKKFTFIQYLLLKYEEASSLHQIVLLSSQIYVAWMVMRLQSSARSIRTLVHHHCCQLNIHLKWRSNTVKNKMFLRIEQLAIIFMGICNRIIMYTQNINKWMFNI